MEPRILNMPAKKLVGQKLNMSLHNDRTGMLWSNFMPRRREISNTTGNDLISLQVYDPGYFRAFDPSARFEKWAAVEVSSFDSIPVDMETLELPEGLYAVFHYQGPSSDKRIFEYIYATWLPRSGYRLDNRPHFEILGEKYRNDDPLSEEEIWIPIQQ